MNIQYMLTLPKMLKSIKGPSRLLTKPKKAPFMNDIILELVTRMYRYADVQLSVILELITRMYRCADVQLF